MKETFIIDDLHFLIKRSSKRKTVELTIDRNGELIIHAPEDYPKDLIKKIAQRKRFWIHTKLPEKELLLRLGKSKEFVNGEGFFYLGRSYRLLLITEVDSNKVSIPVLRLHQGRFMLRRDEKQRGREHFIKWYIKHGEPWIRKRIDLFSDRIGSSPDVIKVRDLSFRWGSCSNGRVNFHWRNILLPSKIIEYIVAHELVHLHEPHHTKDFWNRLERTMPDFEVRKHWLAENGARYYL